MNKSAEEIARGGLLDTGISIAELGNPAQPRLAADTLRAPNDAGLA